MLEKFGFTSSPFTREISVDKQIKWDFIEAEVHKLKQAIEGRMSAVLIAPAGSGKTQAIRSLTAKLPPVRYRVHYVKVTELSKRDMCREIATAFQLRPAGNYPALIRAIQERIDSLLSAAGLRPVLIFDEAHDMRPDVLSMLRLITNFEMDSRLVVSVILVGQPQLKRTLHAENLLDIRQRLNHCGELRLLTSEESRSYLDNRVQIAGATKSPFLPESYQAIYEITRGNMRAIDTLAFKALELAHHGATDIVESRHVLKARGEIWI